MESAQPFARIQRLPPYVFSMVDEIKDQLVKEGHELFDFGMGNPDQPPAPHVIESLQAACAREDLHRYSSSRGIKRLRKAICDWYKRRYDVKLDLETETIVTMGSKEGLAHLALATMGPGDVALVPNPAYPIHTFGFVIAGADVRHIPMTTETEFLKNLETAVKESWPHPKMLVLNFPSNPTGQCVDLKFFKKVVDIALEHRIWVVHDLAYADIAFDGYQPPSILQVPGAKEIAVETYTMSKSYNMPGWRVGFVSGNPQLVAALQRIKSYLDYGMFTPIQIAAADALEGDQSCVSEINEMYRRRRDVLCDGLNAIGWKVEKPKATMFVWAKIPEQYRELGSLEFTRKLLLETKVCVAPGIGFGEYGNDYVRFGLIQDEERTKAAIEAMRHFMATSEAETLSEPMLETLNPSEAGA